MWCISDYFNFFLSIWSFRFWCSFLFVCLFVYFCFCFLFSGFFCGFFLFFFISFLNLFFFVFCLFCFYVVFVLGISAVLLYLLCGDLVKDYIQSYFSIVALLILHLLHQGKEIKYIYKRPTLKLKEKSIIFLFLFLQLFLLFSISVSLILNKYPSTHDMLLNKITCLKIGYTCLMFIQHMGSDIRGNI